MKALRDLAKCNLLICQIKTGGVGGVWLYRADGAGGPVASRNGPPGTPVPAQRSDLQRRRQARRFGRRCPRMSKNRCGDFATLRRSPGQPVAVRRRREPGSDGEAESAHVALPAGLPLGRKHQVLRLPRHCRLGSQQGNRSDRSPIGDFEFGGAIRLDPQSQ